MQQHCGVDIAATWNLFDVSSIVFSESWGCWFSKVLPYEPEIEITLEDEIVTEHFEEIDEIDEESDEVDLSEWEFL